MGAFFMRLLAAYGDKRYAYMASMAQHEGMDAWQLGMDGTGVPGLRALPMEELGTVDVVVMPNLFGKGPAHAVLALLDGLAPGTTLALFSAQGIPEQLMDRYRTIDLSSDEEFLRQNAILTAEGAISAAMREAEFALRQSDCLVIGYGRIGHALTELLVGLGARVTVAARRDTSRRQAVQRGANAISIEEMAQVLPNMQLIFNTPPERVMDETLLSKVHRDTLLIDLSSPPFGMDLQAAEELGLQAWREPGLPGRYCPRSAGQVLLRAVQHAIKSGGDHT